MNSVKLPKYRQSSRLLVFDPKEKLIIEPNEAMSKKKVSTKIVENKIAQSNIGNKESAESIENKDTETNLPSKMQSFSFLRESKGGIGKVVVKAEQEKNNEYSHQEADAKSCKLTDDEDSNDEDYEENGTSTKETHAPLELMAEFLRAEMGHDYILAKKLCQMILIYEPENPEAKEFFSVIEEMLQMEKTQSPAEDDEESEDSSSESEGESSEEPSEDSSDECEDD